MEKIAKSFSFSFATCILIFVLATSCSTLNSDEETGTDVMNISNGEKGGQEDGAVKEVTLNLCSSVVEVTVAQQAYEQVYEKFYVVSESHPISELSETIQATHLASLGAEVAAAHAENGCTGFVPALKVFFGLEGNQIKLLYQTVNFCRSGTTNTYSTHTVSATYSVYTTETGFTTASTAQIGSMANYTTNLKIKEAGGLRPFKDKNDATGDTKAIYLPFQELKAVLVHNDKQAIVIWNYWSVSTSTTNPTRHSIIVSPDSLSPGFLKNDPSFLLKFADRSHLCPPSCNEVTFLAAVTGTPDCQKK